MMKEYTASELTSYINDLACAHGATGLHAALIVGRKVGEMKTGDILTISGSSCLHAYVGVTLDDLEVRGENFRLEVIKRGGKSGYLVNRVN